MKIGRLGLFFIAIVIGVVIGLLVGWVISPRFQPASPSSLRADYKTDYALMVAEIYQAEKDPAAAIQRLAFINEQQPIRTVQEAIVAAEQLQYSRKDITLLANLLVALQAIQPSGGQQP